MITKQSRYTVGGLASNTIKNQFKSASDGAIDYFQNLRTVFINDVGNERLKLFQQLDTSLYEGQEGLNDYELERLLNELIEEIVSDEALGQAFLDSVSQVVVKDSASGQSISKIKEHIDGLKSSKTSATEQKKDIKAQKNKITNDIKNEFLKQTDIDKILKNYKGSNKLGQYLTNSALKNQVFLPLLYSKLNTLKLQGVKLFSSPFMKTSEGLLFETIVFDHFKEMCEKLDKDWKLVHEGSKNTQEDMVHEIKPSTTNMSNNNPIKKILDVLETIPAEYINSTINKNEFYTVDEAGNVKAPSTVKYGYQTKYNSLGKDMFNGGGSTFYRISNHQAMLLEYKAHIHTQLNREPLDGTYQYNQRPVLTPDDLYYMFNYLHTEARIIGTFGVYNVGYFEKNDFIWTCDLIEAIKDNGSYYYGFGYDHAERAFNTAVGAININKLESYYHILKFFNKR